MFYIDFTAPDGNTYRIDLSKHKLIHSCPVCGSEQQIMLDESDPYYWCYDCRERREEQEKIEGYRRRMQENVRRINKLCHSNIVSVKLVRVVSSIFRTFEESLQT